MVDDRPLHTEACARLRRVRRTMLVAGVLTVVTLHPAASGATSRAGWSGSASCTITVTGPGYRHSEAQRWEVSGPAHLRGSFVIVPSRWTDTGGGSSQVTQGDQTRDITWTVKAAAPGQFQFVVRASDGKLVIGQASAQLRAPNGITGTQRVTIGGVAQTPGPVGLEAFETQLPPIVAGPKSRTVSGSMPPTRVQGSYGTFQPGDATVTKRCSWRFVASGAH